MGKRGWLDRLIEQDYLPAIVSLEDSPQGQALALALVADIRNSWTQRGAKTLKQQQSLMDQLRRTIRDRLGNTHFSLAYIDFSREEYFELNHQKQLNARGRQLHQLYLKDPDAIVAQAVRLLDSPEWADVAAGLALLTGRRLNEVLRTAVFSVQSRWVVTFKGALKRRGEDIPLIFDIPTLTTAQRVVSATEKLRAITPSNANEAKVAIACDRHFSTLVPAPIGKANLYSHLWRSVYCCIATFWYCPKYVDDLLFKAHIMGHFESLSIPERDNPFALRQRLETFSSERHYRLYEIDDQLIAYYGGKRKGIKLGVAGVLPLDAFMAGLPEQQPAPTERKHRTSLRIWKEDYDAISAILERFEAKTQQDKVAAWARWSLQQLNTTKTVEMTNVTAGEGANSTKTERETNSTKTEGGAIAPLRPVGFAEHNSDRNLRADSDLTDDLTDDSHRERQEQQAIATQNHVENAMEESVERVTQKPTEEGGVVSAIASSPIEAKLDKLLDVLTLFVQGQMYGLNQTGGERRGKRGARERDGEGQRDRKHDTEIKGDSDRLLHSSTVAVAGDSQNLTVQEKTTRKYKTGEADLIINRAIDAIFQHNDQPGLSHDDKWAISINGLKNFSANQRAIERIIALRKTQIDNHHAKHQLSTRHNDRHKRKAKINQIIHI